MNDHLKQFATHSAYEAVKNNLDKPNVVLCTQEDEVHYNPYVDPFNGHAYVDLGLPSGTKWATVNVGASSETDYGNYYMYGMGSKTYDSTDTPYDGTEDPLATSADTAAQVWGGEWHMPTSAQMEELINNTNNTWTTVNNVNGYKFTSKTDSSKYIFLPAAGLWNNGSQDMVNSGYYWSSSPFNNDAFELRFGNGGKVVCNSYRKYGHPVRGVVG